MSNTIINENGAKVTIHRSFLPEHTQVFKFICDIVPWEQQELKMRGKIVHEAR